VDDNEQPLVHELPAADAHRVDLAAADPVRHGRARPLAVLQRGRLRARAAEPKELYIVPNAGHVDLYDKTDLIPFDKLDAFFTEHLAPGARVGETLAASAA